MAGFRGASVDAIGSVGLLVLRLGAGGFMLTHGWSKPQMLLAGDFDTFPDPLGVGPTLSLVLAVSGEFLGALLVTIGLATRLAAIPVAITMAVAAFVIHASDPWTMQEAAMRFQAGDAKTWSSKEPALLYLFPFVGLIFTGAGRFSLDHLLFGRKVGTPGGGG